MNFSEIHHSTCKWLSGNGGQERDVAISSRVRLARNIAGVPFVNRASSDERRKLERSLSRELKEAPIQPPLEYMRLTNLSSVDTMLLMERHLISKEHADADWERGVAFNLDESVSIMVNEEDHLRMQVMHNGLKLQHAWEDANRIDDILAKRLKYAFSPKYGFLTACPTNVGTGLRVSVMLHLPALAMTRQMEKVFNAVSQLRLAVRGLYGEGTSASGDFYQISNQVCLGMSEQGIVDTVAKVIPEIIRFEREARIGLLSEHKVRVQDRIYRALGLLRMARTISSEEGLHFLSQVRMGVSLGIIEDVPLNVVNELFLLTLPAHLQRMEGRALCSAERNEVRASYIRTRLNSGS